MSKREKNKKYNFETDADLWAAIQNSLEKMNREYDARLTKSVARHLAEMDRWWKENYLMIPRYKKHD